MNQTANSIEKIVSFFDFPHGAMDIASFVPYATDAKTFTASARNESGKSLIVYPASKLADLQKDKVKQMNEKVHSKVATSASIDLAKRCKVIEVVHEMMKVGQLE